ncbi:MAG: MSMEG_4193 family putative phosphomutase [Streptosporangiales bacterium]|nr:MSMEG_4193 family putative phosphomutase [Streptosporangiales bacterium]
MATVILVRHGLTAMTGPVLAGWTPGVHLDGRGRDQAAALARRLSRVPLASVVTSPLERCRETAEAIVAEREGTTVTADERVGECRYGDWTGQRLNKLAKEKLWQVVQAHPSAATFPGERGESLRDTQHRAVSAIRDWNVRASGGTYLVCTHGDVIKAIVADALGLHLDLFQRIQVDPCSLTVIRYTDLRPFLVRLNDTGGGVDDLVPPGETPRRRWTLRRSKKRESDAVVGGGSGSA